MRAMWTRILLPGLMLLPQLAHARNAGWFLKGAESVEIAGAVEVPLYRGTIAEHRPLVAVEREVDGKARSVLAVVDLGHTWTRVGRDLASQLGITPEVTDINGEWAQVATVDSLSIGDLTLNNLRVQVVEGDELILGFGAIDEIAVAILPSTGTVKIVPASQGYALLSSLGAPFKFTRQKGKWVENGEKVFGNGLSFGIPASIAGRDGTFQIRTADAKSTVAADYRGVDERRWNGIPHYRGRGRIKDFEIGESWVAMDESLNDPRDGFIGALGYDQLYVVDIAVSPGENMASVRLADQVTYTSSVDRSLELAWERFKAAGLSEEDKRSVRPPRMGFEDEPTLEDQEGDPGDPEVASIERSLALALWDAGELDRAMPHFLSAAEAAGDRCLPQMDLGRKRLAWSGTLQEQDFIVELIRQPLREAGELWDRWAALDSDTRMKIRQFSGTVPEGTFKIPQDRRCLTAWGTLMAAYVAQGNTLASSEIYSAHYGSDPLVAFAQGISLLAQGQPKTAEIPIRQALSFDVEESGDFELGLARALAEQGKKEPVEALVEQLSGLDVDHPLTAALMAAEWGRTLDGEEGAKAFADLIVQQDPYWIPGQLVALHLGVERASASQVGAELIRQRERFAGDLALEAHAAVHQAIEGDAEGARKALRKLKKDRPPTPDLFAAMALVASIEGDGEALQEARRELRLRYPTIPIGDLGLTVNTD
jgi:tetratricopeptide (TPR) repeat protein